MTDQEYIDRVLVDEHFPKFPRKFIGKDKDDKPIYSFFVDADKFYVQDSEKGKEVCYDFANSKGEKMQAYFYFDKDRNPNQIFPAHLIWGTRFV